MGLLAQTDVWSTILIIIMIYDLPGGEGEGPQLPCELRTLYIGDSYSVGVFVHTAAVILWDKVALLAHSESAS